MIINFKTLLFSTALFSIFLVTSANASIIRPLNGINYEWMELAATAGKSRLEVESLLMDSSSDLYGYKYASRVETQLLFESYHDMPIDLNVWNHYMASGAQEFYNEFGATFYDYYGPSSTTTADGFKVDWDTQISSYIVMGEEGECGFQTSCLGRIFSLAQGDKIQALLAPYSRGWDATSTVFSTRPYDGDSFTTGSLLLKDVSSFLVPVPVPVPGSIWLFLSGLIGLIKFSASKRKDINI